MTHIIALAGRKQSGKTTACNFLHGHEMQRTDPTGDFTYRVNNAGQLVVRTVAIKDGSPHYDEGVLDVQQKTFEFIKYANGHIWPYIRVFNFADTLKDIAIDVLGLDYEQCYGTEDQKNTATKLRWENMPGVITREMFERESGNMLCDWFPEEEEWGSKNMQESLSKIGLYYHDAGPMTGREVLQYLGTDVFRRMYDRVWIDNCLGQIEEEQPAIAVIGDCRFLNEVIAVQDAGGKVVHLTRDPESGDGHASENDLEGFSGYNGEIDNANMTIAQQNEKFLELLVYWGVTDYIRPKYITTVRQPGR